MEDKKSVAYLVGQVMAYIDSVTPGGLTSGKKDLIAQDPSVYIVQPLIQATARAEQIKELAEIISQIPAWPKAQELAKQGETWLGYYSIRANLPSTSRQKNGRRRKEAEIDWSVVDWSKTNAQLAEELGCTPQAVGQNRKKFESAQES